jgi:PAS domain S-box-containing protein
MDPTKAELDKAQKLRDQAEVLNREEDTRKDLEVDIDALSKVGIKTLIHELQVHQIELELQNDEMQVTQQELLISKAKYFKLYNLAPVSYITMDENGIIIETNLTFCVLLGYSRQHIVGKPLSQFVLPKDQDVLYLHKKLMQNSDTMQVCELNLVTNDNLTIWTRLEGICDNENNAISFQCILSDISNKKEAEDTILKNNVSLAKVAKEKSQALDLSNDELEAFSSAVAHDLRKPLRIVDGFAQILMEDYAETLDLEAMRMLYVIKQSATKMDDILKALLNITRIAHAEIKYSNLNMQKVINRAWEEIPLLTKEGVNITIIALPEASGDLKLVHEIWTYLISNAVKFTKNQEVREIKITGTPKEGFVEYCIKDTGAGFSMEHSDQLFKAFHRLHSDKEYEGLGVGLSIVHRIVKKHGGEIRAESKPGEGASFFFTLPAAK